MCLEHHHRFSKQIEGSRKLRVEHTEDDFLALLALVSDLIDSVTEGIERSCKLNVQHPLYLIALK